MSELHTDVLEPGAVSETKRGPQLASATAGSAVIICTRGRAEIVASLVRQLADQTKPPSHVFVIASTESDIASLPEQDGVTARIGRIGSSFQRNDGLALAADRFDFIVFFDDDFVPSRFWLERMESIFANRLDIAGMTGCVLADGTHDAGVALADAKAMVARMDERSRPLAEVEERFAYGGNVGCNMAFRYSAIEDIRFDEQLPLYAWHEDSDFRGQVERRGLFVRTDALWGVHLGHKSGRLPGMKLGYAQIANAVYLARKGNVPASFLARTGFTNVVANALRSFIPEPFVDRRGRLRGNLLALADLLRGRLAPQRVLKL